MRGPHASAAAAVDRQVDHTRRRHGSVRHARAAAAVAIYKVEPYVVAADVYGVSPHTGRGGWTWYTGSASWLFRVALESLLGFRLRGDRATFAPCVPPAWPGFSIRFRYHSATYRVELKTAGGAGGASMPAVCRNQRQSARSTRMG